MPRVRPNIEEEVSTAAQVTVEQEIDEAAMLNTDKDADAIVPPPPDLWAGKKVIYTAIPAFSADKEEDQIKERTNDKGKKYISLGINLKVTMASVPEIPDHYYDGKVVRFVNVNSAMRQDGTNGAVDFLKAAGMKQEVEAAIEEAKQGATVEIRNGNLRESYATLIRQVVNEQRPVQFTGAWEAQEKVEDGADDEGKIKYTYKPILTGMKRFPFDDKTGEHVPVVESTSGEECRANFRIMTWIPKR